MKKILYKSGRIAAFFLFCCVLLTASSGWITAQTPVTSTPAQAKSTLTIRITGFRNAKGKVNIALYRDAKGFPSESSIAIASQRFEIDPQTLTATAVFKDLPQGVYAASVFHDENMTGKMEHNSMGIPQSGYGISNNPNSSFGPPTPEQASFKVNQPESSIEIKMVYWQ